MPIAYLVGQGGTGNASGSRMDTKPKKAPHHAGLFHEAENSVFELWKCLQAIFRRAGKNRVIRIPVIARGFCSVAVCVGTGRIVALCSSRAHGLIHELELAHFDLDVVLAHAKKATDTDDDSVDLSGLVEQNFIDVAEFLVVVVIHIDADELRRPPCVSMRRRSSFAAVAAGFAVGARAGRTIVDARRPATRTFFIMGISKNAA
jgi:hypothetical protein